jgi:hypothetical protein
MHCRFIREMMMYPRCRTRIPVGYPANIHSDTGTGKGVLLDLSPTGCRMRSDIDLNAGAYLALEIAVAQEPTPLAVEVSVVRWCKDGCLGVEFLRYSQGVRERVTDLLTVSSQPDSLGYPDYATASLSAVAF